MRLRVLWMDAWRELQIFFFYFQFYFGLVACGLIKRTSKNWTQRLIDCASRHKVNDSMQFLSFAFSYFDFGWLAGGTLPTRKFEMHNNSFSFPIGNINMRLNLAIGMNINDLWFWCFAMTLGSVLSVSLFTNKSVKLRACACYLHIKVSCLAYEHTDDSPFARIMFMWINLMKISLLPDCN